MRYFNTRECCAPQRYQTGSAYESPRALPPQATEQTSQRIDLPEFQFW
jgi:hypothetical protein